MPNFKPLVHAVLKDYALSWHGTHGVGHWARVLENGLRLAEVTEAKVEVVQLFAVFHDARRINQAVDDGHGQRGADLATELRGRLFELLDDDFALLYHACARHTDGLIEGNITVQTCWDADRLDLGRVGMKPEPKKLCTAAAKNWEMIRWADRRAAFEVVPNLVRAEWGIDLGGMTNAVAERQVIRKVAHGSPEYWATVALRDSILRWPLGLQFSTEELEAESDSRHVACYRGDRLVGCLVLRPLDNGDVQMRQVAVVPELRGQGIGTALVEHVEVLARGLGFRRMVLHARETAVPFYERLRYARIGDSFEEVTIPHWAMEKRLQP
jgi:uncharacterized protein